MTTKSVSKHCQLPSEGQNHFQLEPLPYSQRSRWIGNNQKAEGLTLPTKVCLVKALFFSSSHVWMWELDHKKSCPLKNWCFWTVVLKTLESPLDCKEIKPAHPKGNQSWTLIGRTDAEAEALASWCKELTHWKRPWCWERLKAGRKGDDRGWMASLTWWTWVWAGFESWWRTGRPGVLQSMVLQRVGHDWVTELNLTEGLRSQCNK